jgi:tetratricopeptide (TPR) repeat protein
MAERYGVRYEIGFAHRLLGEISLKNNPAQAEPHFEKSIAIFQEIKAENELAQAYSGYGKLHTQQGETAKAQEYLTKALKIFERLGTPNEPNKVSEELAKVREV